MLENMVCAIVYIRDTIVAKVQGVDQFTLFVQYGCQRFMSVIDVV